MKPEINYNALPDYLANHGTSGDETLFAGVKRLLPGHTLIWRDGKIDIREYWDLRFEPNTRPRQRRRATSTNGASVSRVGAAAPDGRRAARHVPLRRHRFGGDHAAMMSTIVDEPIKTFSVAFRRARGERAAVRAARRGHFNTDHHEIVVTPEQFFEALPKLVWHEDEPIAHPSPAWRCTSYHSSLREHVKVVLTGEGATRRSRATAAIARRSQAARMGDRYETPDADVRCATRFAEASQALPRRR